MNPHKYVITQCCINFVIYSYLHFSHNWLIIHIPGILVKLSKKMLTQINKEHMFQEKTKKSKGKRSQSNFSFGNAGSNTNANSIIETSQELSEHFIGIITFSFSTIL